MTDAQTWTVIGTLLAAVIGMMTLMSTMFVRVVRTEIGGLRAEMNARFETMDAKVTSRFDGLDRRVGHLDEDVRTLYRHTFGGAEDI